MWCYRTIKKRCERNTYIKKDDHQAVRNLNKPLKNPLFGYPGHAISLLNSTHSIHRNIYIYIFINSCSARESSNSSVFLALKIGDKEKLEKVVLDFLLILWLCQYISKWLLNVNSKCLFSWPEFLNLSST